MALTQSQPRQPDISYHPDFEKYQLRSARLKELRARAPDSSLPAGFPKQLTSPLVWEGKDFVDESEWTVSLSGPQLAEIHEALLHFKGKI
jgi:hypothetical protein